MKEYTREPKTCPFCKQNPLVKIQEESKRIDNVEYIRHFYCPYCGKKVELRMLEYFHPVNGFQRNVSVRKIRKREDNEIKRKQRIISIYPHRTTQTPPIPPTRSELPSVDEKEEYLKPRKEAILKWAKENMEDLIRNRLSYSWKNIGRKECERLRNEVSGKIIQSRIRNNGAIDLETLNAVIKWGFGRDYPNNDPQKAMEVSRKAFEYLDKNDIKNATMVLLKEKGVGISRASKIIGLSDQENLCIYDSRVGFALQTLTHDGERLVKIPPSQSRLGDIGVTHTEWVQNYEHLIWITELIRDFMNENGCTYRIADVEMALFMMGK